MLVMFIWSICFAPGSSVTARQACNLPVGPDAVPVIGAVPGVQGIYVVRATGHSCWGILNGPATGKALAEQIVYGRSKSVDMKPFSPARQLPVDLGRISLEEAQLRVTKGNGCTLSGLTTSISSSEATVCNPDEKGKNILKVRLAFFFPLFTSVCD
eukprot:1162067-Pelagomonas_calceolata.AAC.2